MGNDERSKSANPATVPLPIFKNTKNEAKRFHDVIQQAMQEGDDSLFYHLENQLWQARASGCISLGEWSSLMNLLSLWWDGRDDPDGERLGVDC